MFFFVEREKSEADVFEPRAVELGGLFASCESFESFASFLSFASSASSAAVQSDRTLPPTQGCSGPLGRCHALQTAAHTGSSQQGLIRLDRRIAGGEQAIAIEDRIGSSQ